MHSIEILFRKCWVWNKFEWYTSFCQSSFDCEQRTSIRYLTCDPPLKARKQTSKSPPPRAAMGTECPGMSFGFPFSSNLPFRGPMMMQLTRAHIPPVKWTTPLPAKSCGQFHQRFTSSFCTNIVSPKKSNLSSSTEKLVKRLLCEKGARKMLVKLTPGSQFYQHFVMATTPKS